MRNWILLVILLLSVGVSSVAQEIGPEAAVLGKGLFGYNNQIGSDVSSPLEYSYNPAVIPLSLELYDQNYTEFDYGAYDFSGGPDMATVWAYTAFAVGKDQVVRLGYYATNSGSAETRALGEGVNVELSTETIELAFAKKLGPRLWAGVSISPEVGDTVISFEDVTIAKGKAKASFNYRLGVAWLVNNQFTLGATYGDDHFGAEVDYFDLETGSNVGSASGKYKEELLTVGATFNPLEGTYLAISQQSGKLEGPGIGEDIDLTAYCLTQYLSPTTNINLSYSDSGWTYGVQYRDKKWCAGITLGTNVYAKAEEYLGTANSFFAWVGQSW